MRTNQSVWRSIHSLCCCLLPFLFLLMDGLNKWVKWIEVWEEQKQKDNSNYLLFSSFSGMGSGDTPCKAHRSRLARVSCKPERKQIKDNVSCGTTGNEEITSKTLDTRVWITVVCHHISPDWWQSLSLRRYVCVCVSLSHKSEHVWMTCLPVYIGITGGGCLGSKLNKSNYVSLSLALSPARLIHARQSALTKYKLACTLQTAYRIIKDKAGANNAATPHMLYG